MDPNPRRTLWSVLAGVFASGLTITIFVVVLDDVARDLGSTRATLTWVVTGPTLVVAMTMAMFGKLGDMRGHRRVFVAGLCAYAAVALASAGAWNAASLIACRAFGGLAFAAIVPAGSAIVLAAHEPGDRARVLGLWSLVSAGAPLLGIVLGGPLVDAFGWRWIFLFQAPACLAAALWARGLPETAGAPGASFDLLGGAALMAGAGLALAALNRGAAWGWTSTGVLAMAVGAIAAFGSFAAAERRARQPMVPLAWFGLRNFSVPVAVFGLANFSYLGAFFLSPGLLKGAFDMSNTGASQVMLWRPLVFSASAPVAGRLVGRVGARPTALAGALAIAASMLVFAAAAEADRLVLVVVALVLSGFGLGVLMPSVTVLMANAVGDEHLGVASGAFQMLGQFGGTMGLQVLAGIEDSSPGAGGYSAAFLVAAGVAGAATLATWFLAPDAGAGGAAGAGGRAGAGDLGPAAVELPGSP